MRLEVSEAVWRGVEQRGIGCVECGGVRLRRGVKKDVKLEGRREGEKEEKNEWFEVVWLAWMERSGSEYEGEVELSVVERNVEWLRGERGVVDGRRAG